MNLDLKVTTVFEKNYNALIDDTKRFIINVGGTRCHTAGTKIRMYNGELKNIEDIQIGDKVASYNGIGYNTVIETHTGYDKIYSIQQGKGINYNVSSNHVLALKQNSPKPNKVKENGKWVVKYDYDYDKENIHYFTAEEWSNISNKMMKRYSGFKNTYLELEENNNTIDAYYLGLWLGDGSSDFGGGITTADIEIIEYLNSIAIENDLDISFDDRYTYRLKSKTFNKQSELSKEFYKYNLIKNKHIPKEYIYTSYDNRLKLLAGLIDSDGYKTGRNTYCITQKNKKIIEGILELLNISGFYTRGIRESISKMKRKDGSIYSCKVYSIEFNHENFNDLNKYIKVERKKINKDKSSTYNIFNTKIRSKFIGYDNVYGFTLNGDNQLYKLEDGTITHNSSKTYSLSQLIIVYCLTNPKKVVSIVRKSFPSLRATVMRDVIEVLKEYNLYSDKQHNKTENIFTFKNGSQIEFFSVDDEQKIRGRKRNILWMNEANELSFEEFQQLNFRTTDKVFIDFNPSDLYSFIYDLYNRPESIKIHSTYKDNPFLEKSLIREIEELIHTDENYYRIYALGETATPKETIFTHQKKIETFPDDDYFDNWCYGIDFGFSHVTSIIKVGRKDNTLYAKEILYESHLTANDLIQRMKDLNISKSIPLLCDYSRPEMITDLKRAGFKALNANKNVKEGIDNLKSMTLFITKDSDNLNRELTQYKYKRINDIITDEPIKMYDDAIDALRYASLHLKKYTKGGISSSFTSFSL